VRATCRPQNVCKSCGYTWHPRGHSLSPRCPRCGGTRVHIAGGGIALIIAILVCWGICTGGRRKTDEAGKKMAPATAVPATAATTAQAQFHVDETVYAEKPIKLRSEPSSKSAQIARIGRGVRLHVIERRSSWIKVRTPEGEVGFVNTSLVSVDAP